MNTNRLSIPIEKILNHQVKKEATASQIYLSLGAWADSEGYAGMADFLFRHAQEERNHMIKVMDYIMERGGRVKITGIDDPVKDPENLQECLELVFTHEVDNTKAIYDIVNLSQEEKDWATWNFAQWFVKEQIEEEALVLDLLDKLKVAGGTKATPESLLYLDAQFNKMEDEVTLAREASGDKPQ
ncbi:ferritin [Mesonia aestuariivivens]|uniref:Ferritin n=1 Tax=Mesonia aestuariivivens TaxID=2796128 RepID=A0ABS6W313_9FLAO|nr:ferritin [Mesonia aestuariivivens]MBW2962245.1 ferritin [Mesonia aestuariivivens]